MGVKIKTNNHERLIVDDYELTPAERADFGYLDWKAIERGEDSATFMRYKGRLYDLSGEFMAVGTENDVLRGWDGYLSDTFYSGIVVRFAPDHDHVIVGTFYAS